MPHTQNVSTEDAVSVTEHGEYVALSPQDMVRYDEVRNTIATPEEMSEREAFLIVWERLSRHGHALGYLSNSGRQYCPSRLVQREYAEAQQARTERNLAYQRARSAMENQTLGEQLGLVGEAAQQAERAARRMATYTWSAVLSEPPVDPANPTVAELGNAIEIPVVHAGQTYSVRGHTGGQAVYDEVQHFVNETRYRHVAPYYPIVR